MCLLPANTLLLHKLLKPDFYLGKNIDIEKLKGQALKNLGGWGGDRGEEQSPDEYKDQEDYLKHIPRDDLEKKKDYYKEMLRK